MYSYHSPTNAEHSVQLPASHKSGTPCIVTTIHQKR